MLSPEPPEILLSVLVPGLMKRVDDFSADLMRILLAQTEKEPAAEVLMLLDDQKQSTGKKRGALLGQARGRFFSFVDDDDMVEPDYVRSLLRAIRENPEVDVVNFHIDFSCDGVHQYLAKFSIGYPAPPLVKQHEAYDKPSHTMCWRRDLVKDLAYADAYWGEDVDWVFRGRQRLRSEHNIERILYHYRSRTANTEHFKMQMATFGELPKDPFGARGNTWVPPNVPEDERERFLKLQRDLTEARARRVAAEIARAEVK